MNATITTTVQNDTKVKVAAIMFFNSTTDYTYNVVFVPTMSPARLLTISSILFMVSPK